ncbi:MAG: recombinase family protein [Lachnospiraceae bacterium]
MARKSRVNVDATKENTIPKDKQIKTAIYARLSLENSRKSKEKDVIRNQIEICKDYIAENPNLILVETYIENGKTGTNFDRPEFTRLMEDIRIGKVDCLVVRDLSRFGRDYVETGTYLERIFPNIGLRFISVKERYDSATIDSTNEALMIPLQNMINALYSKDISRKVVAAHKTRMSTGVFKRSILPYGYKLDETRTQILVDEEVAPFVKMIFKWKLEGVTISKMIEKLTDLNAPNVDYQKAKTEVCKRTKTIQTGWHKPTIQKMLKNPTYVGDTVLGRTERALYKGMPCTVYNDSNEWIIHENTHEAIISREDFNRVNELMKESAKIANEKLSQSEKIRSQLINLFDEKIFCADCNYKMYFLKNVKDGKAKPTYKCSSYQMQRNTGCTSHCISSNKLEEKVLAAIKAQVKVALNYEQLLSKLRDSEGEKSIREKQNAIISSLNLKLNGIQNKRTRLYEDFVEGILTEEEYGFVKSSYDDSFVKLNEQLDDAITRKANFIEAMSSDNKWIKLMKSVSKAKKLTDALVNETIEKVLVHENGDIELVMRYADIYALTTMSIKEVQREEKVA